MNSNSGGWGVIFVLLLLFGICMYGLFGGFDESYERPNSAAEWNRQYESREAQRIADEQWEHLKRDTFVGDVVELAYVFVPIAIAAAVIGGIIVIFPRSSSRRRRTRKRWVWFG